MKSRGPYKVNHAGNTPNTLGQRIRACRHQFLMSQADLAQSLGVPQQSISSWERDLTEPSRQSMDALVRCLGVSELTLQKGYGFEVPDLQQWGVLLQEDVLVNEAGSTRMLSLPSAAPGEAWGVVIGAAQVDPLNKQQAIELVSKAYDDGDAFWVVVKPRGKYRATRDLLKEWKSQGKVADHKTEMA